MDLYVNDKLIDCFKNSGECCGVVFEENEEFIFFFVLEFKLVKYVVVFDLLDGFFNIDVNVFVGIIFGIYRWISDFVEFC